MADNGEERQYTDRELAGVGIILGGLLIVGCVVVCADGRWDGLLMGAAGVTCLVLGWGRRKDRHNPEEMPRHAQTLEALGASVGATLRKLRRKR